MYNAIILIIVLLRLNLELNYYASFRIGICYLNEKQGLSLIYDIHLTYEVSNRQYNYGDMTEIMTSIYN